MKMSRCTFFLNKINLAIDDDKSGDHFISNDKSQTTYGVRVTDGNNRSAFEELAIADRRHISYTQKRGNENENDNNTKVYYSSRVLVACRFRRPGHYSSLRPNKWLLNDLTNRIRICTIHIVYADWAFENITKTSKTPTKKIPQKIRPKTEKNHWIFYKIKKKSNQKHFGSSKGCETMVCENASKGAISRLPAIVFVWPKSFRNVTLGGVADHPDGRTFVPPYPTVPNVVLQFCFVPITTTLVCETKQWTWPGRQSSDVNWIRARKNSGRMWVSLS